MSNWTSGMRMNARKLQIACYPATHPPLLCVRLPYVLLTIKLPPPPPPQILPPLHFTGPCPNQVKAIAYKWRSHWPLALLEKILRSTLMADARETSPKYQYLRLLSKSANYFILNPLSKSAEHTWAKGQCQGLRSSLFTLRYLDSTSSNKLFGREGAAHCPKHAAKTSPIFQHHFARLSAVLLSVECYIHRGYPFSFYLGDLKYGACKNTS